MSCFNRSLNNLDTTIYTQSSNCGCNSNNGPTIKYVDRPVPVFYCPNFPQFPPAVPAPPLPPTPPTTPTPAFPTNSYAQFFNTAATGVTYAAGTTIPFPSTQYNTDATGIVNNNGVITLSGGTTGRTYLINYQVTGTPTGATVGLIVNGTNDTSSNVTATSTTDQTLSGNYMLNVPANTSETVALQVIAGTLATATPTSGTNISITRIM